MAVYRQRLPHIYEPGHGVFLTWRLHDSLPPNRAFPNAARSSVLPYLSQLPVADMIVEAIHHNADEDGIL